MIYYYLTKDGSLKRTAYNKLSSYDPNVLDIWAIVKHRQVDHWVCLLEALALGVKTEDADTFAKTYDLHGQSMLEMFGRLNPTPKLKTGLERYLTEFLKIKDIPSFYAWVSRQNGPGKLVDYYKEYGL